MMFSWLDLFDERQQKEIKFSILYATQFLHGTDGHNAKMIIAKFSEILNGLCEDRFVRDHLDRMIAQKKIDNDEK